jgi:hypothetical protein
MNTIPESYFTTHFKVTKKTVNCNEKQTARVADAVLPNLSEFPPGVYYNKRLTLRKMDVEDSRFVNIMNLPNGIYRNIHISTITPVKADVNCSSGTYSGVLMEEEFAYRKVSEESTESDGEDMRGYSGSDSDTAQMVEDPLSFFMVGRNFERKQLMVEEGWRRGVDDGHIEGDEFSFFMNIDEVDEN